MRTLMSRIKIPSKIRSGRPSSGAFSLFNLDRNPALNPSLR